MGTYVMMIANGDREILASSGFDMQKEPARTAPVAAPAGIEAIVSTNPGEVEIKVNAVKNKRNYHFEYTPDPVADNSVWTAETDTNRRHIFKGLQSAKKYWFRVAATGKGEDKKYSNVVSCIVQ